ncbi:MAG: hypothetical protein WCC27_06470 [Acidobacteriaceae bacterium]
MPLGHKFFAVLLAIAVGAGVFTWQHRRAAQSVNAAVLSFDTSAAQQIDPGLVQAAQPAVALAQSILTDSAVATLSKPAFLSSSNMNNRIGEFRSRLVLSEPSRNVLRVQFTDADSARSADTANAVAKTLAAWTPAAAAAPPPAIETPAPSPAPVSAAAPTQTPSAAAAGPSLSTSLGDLDKQLSATNRELDQLGSSPRRTRYGRHSYESYSHGQAKQQQLLNTRIRAAEKQLDDLRTQFSANSPGANTRLDEIHEALASIVPAGGARRASGFNAAGTSSRQLREEREELTDAIAVVEKQRHAIQTEEAANTAPAPAPSGTSAPSASVSGTPASGASNGPAPSSGVSESNLPGSSASQPSAPPTAPLDAQSGPHPLTLVKSADAAPHTPLMPAVVAGLACFLVYLIGAAIRYRPSRKEAAYENPGRPTGFRFITPNEPVARAAQTETPYESTSGDTSWHRASFSYEPPPPDTPPFGQPDAPSTKPDPGEEDDDNPRHSSRLFG